LSSEILAPLRARGWSTGSLHPLISVTDPHTPLDGAFWCVEGEPRAARLAKAIVRDLGGTSFSINAAEKPLYHAAAVMTAGHVTALFDVALEMLVACGLTRKPRGRFFSRCLRARSITLKQKSQPRLLLVHSHAATSKRSNVTSLPYGNIS
jgi:predicted short-subunit dehydrogenase-like oxidoreductase (DUF2520 family)